MDDVRSPSGTFEVRVEPWEARMSLWVDTPTVVDRRTRRPVLSFSDSRWSLNHATWLSEVVVELHLRKYPGSHTPPEVTATLNCEAKSAQVGGDTVPLRELEAMLDRMLTWPAPVPPDPPQTLWGRLLRRLGRGSARGRVDGRRA